MYDYENAHALAHQEIRRLHAVIDCYKQEFKNKLQKQQIACEREISIIAAEAAQAYPEHFNNYSDVKKGFDCANNEESAAHEAGYIQGLYTALEFLTQIKKG